MNKKVKFSGLWTAILSVVSVAYIFPILLVLINSFKKKAYISRYPFAIPTDKMFVGLENYVNGLTKTGFFQACLHSIRPIFSSHRNILGK